MTNNNELNKYILPAGVAVGGYFLVVKPILQKLGVLDSAEEQKIKADRERAIAEALAAAARQKPASYNDAQIGGFADTIYNALRYSRVDDDYETAGLYLCYPKNDTDVYKLIQTFGTREECYFSIFCMQKTLPEMVKNNLSADKIRAINDNYMRKGIQYRW